jgi:hypothetical protein
VKMLQTYETTVMSKDSDHAIYVVVVPKGSLPASGNFPIGRIDATLTSLILSSMPLEAL